uniref:Uncharacterized protein n=1 Tax=Panagrolaimus superbus TaxID=310955 RepID=A0A914Y9I8_9BILA
MLWYLCYYRNAPWSDMLFHRVESYTYGLIASMINYNYCKCSFALILSLGKNEESAKTYLSKIYEVWDHPKAKNFDITSALKANYLGNLLELRRTFSDDVYYHYRRDIIKSLIVLINNLNVDFFSSTPGRMLTVLKAIDPIEFSLDAWMAFLQRLDPIILEKQIHLVLLALPKTLIELPGAKKVFEYISGVRRKADSKKPYR